MKYKLTLDTIEYDDETGKITESYMSNIQLPTPAGLTGNFYQLTAPLRISIESQPSSVQRNIFGETAVEYPIGVSVSAVESGGDQWTRWEYKNNQWINIGECDHNGDLVPEQTDSGGI